MCTRRSSSIGSSLGIWYVAMYAHICRHTTATSRLRERGVRTQSANGAVAAVAVTTGGGSRTRHRADGGRPAHSAGECSREGGGDVASTGSMRTFVFGYGSLLRLA